LLIDVLILEISN